MLRRKVHDRDNLATLQLGALVVGDLSGRAALADIGPKIDAELPRRAPRLGEVLDLDDAAEAYDIYDRREALKIVLTP